MRTSEQKLNPSLKRQIIKTFTQAVADLKDYGETDIFIKDFFTKPKPKHFLKDLQLLTG